ncbi:hypothetical protein M3Y94_01052500 [Aphelenchoides besseyi]|nr:hypothetical protein M3Y94_01052500 [Aphelenchoides besseyi]
MQNNTNCSARDSAIFVSCDCGLPLFFCAFANISGYCSLVLWLFVLIPQVWRNFRHRTVVGISCGWAIANFTAAFNNTFFVIKSGNMPWYLYGYIYMPVIEFVMLLQFIWYTPSSRNKVFISVFCLLSWTIITLSQVFFDVYHELEWVTIALWSVETIPQVFLNMRRQSTHGLSNLSVSIIAICKSLDFMQTYLLVMPIQYIVMAFFSSTVSEFGTLQVIWYWNQQPVEEKSDVIERYPISPRCNFLRWFGLTVFGIELLVFIVALIVRTRMMWLLVSPVVVYSIIFGYYFYINHLHKFRWLRADTVNRTADEGIANEKPTKLPL